MVTMNELDELEFRLRKIDIKIQDTRNYQERMRLYKESFEIQRQINKILGGI